MRTFGMVALASMSLMTGACDARGQPPAAAQQATDVDFELEGDPDFDFDPFGGITIESGGPGMVAVELPGAPRMVVSEARLGATLQQYGLPDPDSATYAADLAAFRTALTD